MSLCGSSVVVRPPVGLLEAGASPDLVATMYAEYYRATRLAVGPGSGASVACGGDGGCSHVGVSKLVGGGEEKWLPVSPESSVSHAVSAPSRSVVSAWESIADDVQRKLDTALQSYGEGYCYLAAVTWVAFDEMAARFGSTPIFRDLVEADAECFEDDAYLASLRIDVVGDAAHVVARRTGGTTFLTLCRSFEVGEFGTCTLVGRTADLARCGATFVRDKSFKIGIRTLVDLELAFDRLVGDGIFEVGYVSKQGRVGAEFAFTAPPLRRVSAMRFWQRPASVSRIIVNGDPCDDKYIRLHAGTQVVVSASYEISDLWLSFIEVNGSNGKGSMSLLHHIDLFTVLGALVSPGGLDLVADLVRQSGVTEGENGKWCTVVVRTATSVVSCRFALAAVDGAALLSAIDADSGFKYFDADSVVHDGGGELKSLDLVVGEVRCHVVLIDMSESLTPPVIESGDFPSDVAVARFSVGASLPIFSVEGANRAAGGRAVQSVLDAGRKMAASVDVVHGKWSCVSKGFFPSVLDGRVSRVTFRYAKLPVGFSLVWWKR